MTTPPTSGPSRSKQIIAFLGIVADMAGVSALLSQGFQPVLLVGVGLVFLGAIVGFLAPKRAVKALGAGLLVVGLVGSAVLIMPFIRQNENRAQPITHGSAVPSPSIIASESASATGATTSAAYPSQPSNDASTAQSTPIDSATPMAPSWYNLTSYEPVASGNGLTSVNSITIGGIDYPSSIRGDYGSSLSAPNNRRTWLTKAKCSRLSVWVGKDAASSQTPGTGRFIVQAEGAEVASDQATITDPARHIDIPITGVVRLTLLDTRNSSDAYNAWGTPQVYCTTPPGQSAS